MAKSRKWWEVRRGPRRNEDLASAVAWITDRAEMIAKRGKPYGAVKAACVAYLAKYPRDMQTEENLYRLRKAVKNHTDRKRAFDKLNDRLRADFDPLAEMRRARSGKNVVPK